MVPKMLRRLVNSFDKGKSLAKELKADSSDPFVNLSFAYALETIGKARTIALFDRAGIEYFVRYTPATLVRVYKNINSIKSQKKPLMLALFAKHDNNGAFIREGRELEKLTRYYHLIINEVESSNGFHLSIRRTPGQLHRPATYIIAGHGSPTDIRLGRRIVAGYTLATYNLDLIRRLKGSIGSLPTVILVSCSTGQNEYSIGNLISKTWDARLFAPVFPSSKTSYNLDKNGKITSVSYNVPTKEFKNGRK
jgi:hypothetical protein